MSLDFSLLVTRPVEIFDINITHNLIMMASEAGIYECLWRPDENGYEKARDIIPLLRKGLANLVDNPEHFKKFNPKNNWGNYDGFVKFVRKVLEACETEPEATIEVSR